MFLSLNTCKDLNLIHQDFPKHNISMSPEVGINTTIVNKETSERVVPNRPDQIPFPGTPENIPKLEIWLKDIFAQTAFNITDPLPIMTGEPQKFHLKENAIPYAATTPIPIPYHWK